MTYLEWKRVETSLTKPRQLPGVQLLNLEAKIFGLKPKAYDALMRPNHGADLP